MSCRRAALEDDDMSLVTAIQNLKATDKTRVAYLKLINLGHGITWYIDDSGFW